MAEIELSVLSRQCMNARIPDQDTLKKTNHCMARATKDDFFSYAMAFYR